MKSQPSSAAGVYCLACFLIASWPVSGYIAGAFAFLYMVRKGGRRIANLGSARFASKGEMKQAGMLDGKSGLILGRITGHKGLVRMPPKTVHTVVCAPTGVGKGVSLGVPFLLSSPDSCFVLDPKGELVNLTADARERMGHRIVIIDPYKLVTE